MSVTDTNVIVGAATLYVAPLDTDLPVATLALGAAWPTGWVSPGATTEGVTLSYDRKTQDITIEEQSTPPLVVTDTMDITLGCTLSEDTVQNMLLTYGGGSIAATAPGDGTVGYSILTLSDTLAQQMVGFEAQNTIVGMARRVIIPIAVISAKVDTAYRRAKAQRSYLFTARAICPQDTITIVEQTAAAS